MSECIGNLTELCLEVFLKSFRKVFHEYRAQGFVANPPNSPRYPSLSSVLETTPTLPGWGVCSVELCVLSASQLSSAVPSSRTTCKSRQNQQGYWLGWDTALRVPAPIWGERSTDPGGVLAATPGRISISNSSPKSPPVHMDPATWPRSFILKAKISVLPSCLRQTGQPFGLHFYKAHVEEQAQPCEHNLLGRARRRGSAEAQVPPRSLGDPKAVPRAWLPTAGQKSVVEAA